MATNRPPDEALTLQEQHADLMKRGEMEPTIADVIEAMRQVEVPPYSVFWDETEVTSFALGTNV